MSYTDYPFDPTAARAGNKITDEIQAINLSNTVAIIPDQGAFFSKDFSLEVRKGSGAWVKLENEVDFSFSPIFLLASAKATRKRVFSYVVITKKGMDIDSARLTYQALGKYEDKELLATIANADWDMTKSEEWARLEGSAATYNPITRNPVLANQSLKEIIATQLEFITNVLADPASGGKDYSQQIALMELRVGKTVDEDKLNDMLRKPNFSKSVGTSKYTVYNLPKEVVAHVGQITFVATDGSYYSATVKVYRDENNKQQINVVDVMSQGGATLTNIVARSLKDVFVQSTPNKTGNLYYHMVKDCYQQ